jgi:hypothetical protein
MLGDLRALLTELLTDVGVDNPGQTAHAVASWLLGSIVQQHIRPRPAPAVQAELSRFLT